MKQIKEVTEATLGLVVCFALLCVLGIVNIIYQFFASGEKVKWRLAAPGKTWHKDDTKWDETDKLEMFQ